MLNVTQTDSNLGVVLNVILSCLKGGGVMISANKGATNRGSSNVSRCWIDCVLEQRVKGVSFASELEPPMAPF